MPKAKALPAWDLAPPLRGGHLDAGMVGFLARGGAAGDPRVVVASTVTTPWSSSGGLELVTTTLVPRVAPMRTRAKTRAPAPVMHEGCCCGSPPHARAPVENPSLSFRAQWRRHNSSIQLRYLLVPARQCLRACFILRDLLRG